MDAVVKICVDRGVPLIILGPTPAAYSRWSQRVVRQTNAAIGRRLAGTRVTSRLSTRCVTTRANRSPVPTAFTDARRTPADCAEARGRGAIVGGEAARRRPAQTLDGDDDLPPRVP